MPNGHATEANLGKENAVYALRDSASRRLEERKGSEIVRH